MLTGNQATLPDESNETAVRVTTNFGLNKINLNHMAGVVVIYKSNFWPDNLLQYPKDPPTLEEDL